MNSLSISGKSWIYKAISITYLKGYTSSYIHDYVHFPSNVVENGEHQQWLVSTDYNKADLPDFIKKVNDKLETTAFMVIQNDSIIFEEYWHGYYSDSASNSFSMAKSYISTLIGIAIKEGKIKSIDQKVCEYIPEFCEVGNANITIKHLLTMSSGLNWDENYYNPIGQTAEAYYGNDLRGLVIDLQSIETPGKVFKYHSSCTQLLAFVVERATGKTISEYVSEKLWKPMGSKHPALWNGNQILDTSYVKEATSVVDLLDEDGDKNVNYGYQFWLSNYKGLDIYYARGLWGQYVICIPEKDMIVVRLGRKYGNLLDDMHHKDFDQFIAAALEMYN